ncbi:phage head-tail adaptor [Parabacteroides sp. CAG:2]|nr:phage head-tail adaptor [Parabacteroides sp. CAG:2]
MRAGLLNYPITIQEPITLKDVYGANGIDWKDAISTRAQVTYNSGNRQNQNNEIIHCYSRITKLSDYHTRACNS